MTRQKTAKTDKEENKNSETSTTKNTHRYHLLAASFLFPFFQLIKGKEMPSIRYQGFLSDSNKLKHKAAVH